MIAPARRYAGIDAALEGLPTAFDLEAMGRLYESRWSIRAPGLRVVATSVHDVDYRPAARCRVSHDLMVERPGQPAARTFGVVDVRPGGLRLRPFDEDPELPWLAEAKDPENADRHFRAEGMGGTARVVGVVPVRYKVGSRCLLRLETEAGPVYLKILASDVERVVKMARQLRDVPYLLRPLGHSPEQHMIVFPAVAGNLELHRVVFDTSVPVEERLQWMRKAGTAIATLHAARLPAGPARRISEDAHELWATATPLACTAPSLMHPYNEAVRRLTSTSFLERPPVASHGAYRTDQLMIAGDQPVIVDLDGLCWASPARDAGNFCASLRWKAIREPHHAAFIEHGIASFMDGYASVRTTPDEHWMDRYTAGSMLKIAARRFRKLNVSEWPLIPQLLDEAHELLRRSERTTSAHGLAATLPAPVNLALDAGTMTAHLRPLLGWSADDHEAPAVTRAELIGEKPEHRWTFQYKLSGELQQVVGKVYREKGRGQRVHGVLRWLSASAVGVPRALGWIDELSMLAYLPVPGRLLSDRLFSARAPLDMDLTAAWLAALHGSELPLDRTFDVGNELKNLREWAAVVSDHYPEHAWAADRIATRLVDCAPLLGAETSRPIHKDFHYQHVFVGEQAHVIDLDEVRLGDPAFDLAHFCAYLRLLGCRFPAMAATLERRRDEFLTAYELHAGCEIGSQFALFYAYTCLKIAKQLCTSRGLSPRPQVEEEHRQTAEMLREGLTALACG